ncbi:hypothetical protein V5799_005153 [Amblyomma americanum]|uniref:Uncharacterized protein n=1 Tax=Amblyomma americanum TaxID=6943 RepID=A0AAQ4E023_AMBAM
MQEVGRVSGVALACREYSPVSTAVPVVASKEWPTGQLAQRIRSQQQALSRQLGEMSLAATGESLDTLAAALRSCQVAHAQAAAVETSPAATGAQAFLHMAQTQLRCQRQCLSAWEAALRSVTQRSCSS